MDFNFPEILKIPDLLKIWEVNDGQIEDMENGFDIIDNNQYFDTLNIDAIKSYEKIFDLYPRQTDTLENRRFRIKRIFLEKIPYSYRVIEKNLNALCPCTIERTVASDGYSYRLDVNADVPSPSDLIQVRNYLDNILPLDMPFALHMSNVLKFKSSSSFTMNVTESGWDGLVWYSYDNDTWTEWDGSTITATLQNENSEYSIYFTGSGNSIIAGGYDHRWKITGSNVEAVGSIMSVLGVGSTMADRCYAYMFSGCTALTTAPALPATTLADWCYDHMFSGCSSLTTAPQLPATTLADWCYSTMFNDCSALTTAPQLPATTLADWCYAYMFSGCSSLTTAPALPATTLADWCYAYMFSGCTKISALPALPATKMKAGCYNSMFRNCSGLYFSSSGIPFKIPSSGSGSIASYWADNMFYGCSGSLPGGTGTPTINTEYYYLLNTSLVFEGTNVQLTNNNIGEEIKYSTDGSTWANLANGASTTTASKLWLKGYIRGLIDDHASYNPPTEGIIEINGTNVSVSGSLVGKNNYSGLFYNQTALVDASGLVFPTNCGKYLQMFRKCTNLTATPALPATTLTPWCYYKMFDGCRALTVAPALPATRLNTACYHDMFYGCSALTTAPALPATTLAATCYAEMFMYCTALTTAPALPATTLEGYSYWRMFYRCTSLKMPPALPATTMKGKCYEQMFYECSGIKFGNFGTPYRLPSSGTGTEAQDWANNMFYGCSGSLPGGTGTPTINTTYHIDDSRYITFTSPENFTLSLTDELGGGENTWNGDGYLEYSTGGNWQAWNYQPITADLEGSSYVLYLRGFNNTRTAEEEGGASNLHVESSGTSTITMSGNFDNLLDCTASTLQVGLCWGLFALNGSLNLNNFTLSSNITGEYEAGNFGYMFYGSNITTPPALPATTLTPCCYYHMFYACTALTTAPQLPATTLADWCYYQMFTRCSALTAAPVLPATTLVDSCYAGMFTNCTSLTTAPELPATTLAVRCYQSMFAITGITTAPTLPATTMFEDCYNSMFSGCESLTTAPQLPATTLDVSCYEAMFYGCEALTSAPTLPAATLQERCYREMFAGCITLTTPPVISATTLADSCCYRMFRYCESLTIPPQLPATTLAAACYREMFRGCTSLDELPTLPAITMSSYCYYMMFEGCSGITFTSSGTSYRLPASGTGTEAQDWSTGMFQGCSGTIPESTGTPTINTTYHIEPPDTVFTFESSSNNVYITNMLAYELSYSKDNGATWTTLPINGNTMPGVGKVMIKGQFDQSAATTSNYLKVSGSNVKVSGQLQNEVNYRFLFYNQYTLSDASGLIGANVLTEYDYYRMFYSCSSLTSAPQLPATTLADDCYREMFMYCSALETPPALPATTLADECYQSMFENCYELTTAPALPATTLVYRCYAWMFENCESLTTPPALPATTLADSCYYCMFNGCTALTSTPTLSATTLFDDCYYSMFKGCTGLTSLPVLPATTMMARCYQTMFADCNFTWAATTGTPYRLPASGTGTTASNWSRLMFTGNKGAIPEYGTPSINTTYYLFTGATLKITGLLSTDTVEGTMNSTTITPTWNAADQSWNFTLNDVGTITVTATRGTETTSASYTINDSITYTEQMSFFSVEVYATGTKQTHTLTAHKQGTSAPIYYPQWTAYSSRLPQGYTELESITSNGGSYIDTGIVFSSPNYDAYNYTLEVKGKMEKQYDCLYGVEINSYYSISLNLDFTGDVLVGYTAKAHPRWFDNNSSVYDISPMVDHLYKTKSRAFYIDGTEKMTHGAQIVDSQNRTLFLFARNTIGEVSWNTGNVRMSYFKLWDQNNNLLCDYIPAKRNSDNEVGMFDLVSNTFKTNTGTGAFIAGAEVGAWCFNSFDQAGTYVIEASDGCETVSKNVTISSSGTYTVGIEYTPEGMLKFEPVSAGSTLRVRNNYNSCKVSYDEGATWATLNVSVYTEYNTSVWLKEVYSAVGTTSTPAITVDCGGAYKIKGRLTGNSYAYCFYNDSKVKDISGLIGSENLTDTRCYQYMFATCTALTTPPILPALELTDYSYYWMFGSCVALTAAPALPATTLAQYCYQNMFYECSNLTSIPSSLPATVSPYRCCYRMFRNCTTLRKPINLPATTLSVQCYYQMFYGCSINWTTDTTATPYRLPSEGSVSGTPSTNWSYQMFTSNGGTPPGGGTPVHETTYHYTT